MLQAQIGESTWVLSVAMGLGRVWGSWQGFFSGGKAPQKGASPHGATHVPAPRRHDDGRTSPGGFGDIWAPSGGNAWELRPGPPPARGEAAVTEGDEQGFGDTGGDTEMGQKCPPRGAARGQRSSAERGRALGTAALGTRRLSTRWHQEPERCPQGTGSIWGAGWAALEPTDFVAGVGKEKRAPKLLLVLHPITLCTTACSWGALQITLPKPPQLPRHPTRSQTMSLADDSSVQILVLRTSSPLSPHTPWDPPGYHPLEAPRCPFYQLCG